MPTNNEGAHLLGLTGAVTHPDPATLARLEAALDAEKKPKSLGISSLAALPALVALVPEAIGRHQRLGIPEDITRATLLDVGSKIGRYGDGIEIEWLLGMLRADVVTVGRLQYERLLRDGYRGIHIPEGPPLTPELVDQSLSNAVELLGDDPMECISWILDPSLAALGPESNLVRFARRFAIDDSWPGWSSSTGEATEGDDSVCRFVFRQPLEDVLNPDIVTPKTRVERLVAGRLRAGKHWTEPRGFLR